MHLKTLEASSEDLSKIVTYTTQLLYKTWKFLTRQSEFYLDETMPFSANEIRIKMGVEDTIWFEFKFRIMA